MRILHVYKDFAPLRGGGGVARHIHGLAVLAAQAGCVVRVVAPAAEDPGKPDYTAVAIAASGLWPQIGWADVVHVHGARTPIAALAALLARCRGKRVVYTPHCYYDDAHGLGKRLGKRLWDALVERPLLRRADRVVLLSDYWRDYLQARRMPATHALLLPNAVLAMELAAVPVTAAALDGAPALLSVGLLDAVKRLHDAIALLAVPGMEQAVLHLVGRGPDRPRLEAFAQGQGVDSRVRFHGFVCDAEVASMAARADAFVLPSAVEGMPTVLIEMLLLGCPVLASDIPGNRAILQPLGLQDALYPLGDVAALAMRVQSLGRRRVAPQVMTAVHARFTWEGIRPQVLGLYDSLIAKEPAP